MNPDRIVQAAVQKLAEDKNMTEMQLRGVCIKVVNYTLQAVIENIKDDENPIMLREKIKGMEVE